MPTERLWRLEAVARLLGGMALCMMLGLVALTLLQFDPAHARTSPASFYGEAAGAILALFIALAAVAKPWTLESFKVRAGALLIGAYLGLTLAAVAHGSSGIAGPDRSVLGMLASTASFQGAAIGLIWVFVRQHGLTLRDAFGLRNGPGHAALLGVTVALGFVPLGLGLQFAIGSLAHQLHLPLPEQDAVFILRLADSWGDRIVLGMVTIVIAPLAEEGLFRGIFYPTVKRLGYPNVALWGTSLVFGLIHFNALSLIPLIVLAVVLVKLYERTGNLLACIVCHATFNAFNFILLFLLSDQGRSLPSQP